MRAEGEEEEEEEGQTLPSSHGVKIVSGNFHELFSDDSVKTAQLRATGSPRGGAGRPGGSRGEPHGDMSGRSGAVRM